MLSVGDADALIFHVVYRELNEPWHFTAVIDAGKVEDGQKVVDFIWEYHNHNPYKGKPFIDLVVATHPDGDHIGGLKKVLESCYVSEIWIRDIEAYKDKGTIKLATRQQNLDLIHYILQCFGGDIIKQPFAGDSFIPLGSLSPILEVVGPTKEYFHSQLSNLRPLKIPKEALLLEAQRDCFEIDPPPETAENNISIIMKSTLIIGGREYRLVFLGDAGKTPLTEVKSSLDQNITWLKIPHHGSKAGLSRELLDYLRPKVTYVSAAFTDDHPTECVVKTLREYGCRTYGTKRAHLRSYAGNMPAREGWSKATQITERDCP